MRQKSIPVPLVATVVTILVLLAGVFIYKGIAGGTTGDGKAGNVQASPPMPEAARQQVLQNAQNKPH